MYSTTTIFANKQRNGNAEMIRFKWLTNKEIEISRPTLISRALKGL